MPRLKIIQQGNEILRKRSQEVAQITAEIKQLIFDMAKTMKKARGIGLAAPQVSKNLRLCLVSTEKGVKTLINPKIIWKSLRKEIEEEGCLSCEGAYGLVKRNKVIYVKAMNEHGKGIRFRAQGLFARVIQHEVDHLDGVLIIDKFVKEKN